MKQEIRLPKGYELKELEDGVYEVIQKTEGLEIGKDYIRAHANGLVINRVGDFGNCGFSADGENYFTTLCCSDPKEWREATKEEVVSFFEKHLIERYGEDWKNVKIKDSIYGFKGCTNKGVNYVNINKYDGCWRVLNKNGCLFYEGKWAEVLEENKLEVGKDYIHIHGDYLIINRSGDAGNLGFTCTGLHFDTDLYCSNPKSWREATEEEVKKFFERHLIERYGENWKYVKVKECMYQDGEHTNEGLNSVDIDKYGSSWMVWNKNACLYYKGKWAEVLEKIPIIELRGLDKKWKWCAMDSDGAVFIFELKPNKNNASNCWYHQKGNALNCKHLDQSQFTELKKLYWKDSLHNIKHV